MNEKIRKALSPKNRGLGTRYKGFGVTTKWTPTYIDRKLRQQKIAKLMLENF